MRILVLVLALTGFVITTGCTNTATGFGKDLEKSGQAIQKTVTKKPTASSNNAGSNSNITNGAAYDTQQYQQQAAPTPLYNNSDEGYTPTPSGY